MNEIKKYTEKMLEEIKHIDRNGNEYWEARELQPILEYSQWRRFENAIDKAKIVCKNSKVNVDDHFANVGKMVQIGSKTRRELTDYKLSGYACYLIVQNADSRKYCIALGQTYFAIQTRKQELNEKEYNELTEDEKRFYQRNLTRKGNYSLNIAAKNAGVKNFDKFHNSGCKDLYNGETANDIAKRKNLRYREDILNNIGSDELIANLFRIYQAEQKLRNENVKLENEANKTHYEVGKEIRNTIKKLGVTMPENLPTPDKSLKELEKENKNQLLNKKM
ncbi:MAG: DNA damage-inducible protein D [Bacilli bacterium]|nr:DNA damage-inducible protein D [Bacilli bacterium]